MAGKDEKSVAKRGETAVAAYDYGEQADAGFENQTGDDLALPFIGVLQALSPQVDDSDDRHIDGARAGMLYNTVTEALFDGKDGVEFIPALTEHVFVEWVPRNRGGGFVARHQPTSDVVAKAKEGSPSFGVYATDYTPTGDEKSPFQGNDLIETFYVYGVVVGEQVEPVVLAFTSTKIKVYKRWATKLNMFTIPGPEGRKIRPPLFAHRVRLTTQSQKNNNGSFHNFALSPAEGGSLVDSLLPPDDPRFLAAKDCYDMVKSGAARASYETQHGGEGKGGDGEAGTPF